jgi:hypothetical protein
MRGGRRAEARLRRVCREEPCVCLVCYVAAHVQRYRFTLVTVAVRGCAREELLRTWRRELALPCLVPCLAKLFTDTVAMWVRTVAQSLGTRFFHPPQWARTDERRRTKRTRRSARRRTNSAKVRLPCPAKIRTLELAATSCRANHAAVEIPHYVSRCCCCCCFAF